MQKVPAAPLVFVDTLKIGRSKRDKARILHTLTGLSILSCEALKAAHQGVIGLRLFEAPQRIM